MQAHWKAEKRRIRKEVNALKGKLSIKQMEVGKLKKQKQLLCDPLPAPTDKLSEDFEWQLAACWSRRLVASEDSKSHSVSLPPLKDPELGGNKYSAKGSMLVSNRHTVSFTQVSILFACRYLCLKHGKGLLLSRLESKEAKGRQFVKRFCKKFLVSLIHVWCA